MVQAVASGLPTSLGLAWHAQAATPEPRGASKASKSQITETSVCDLMQGHV